MTAKAKNSGLSGPLPRDLLVDHHLLREEINRLYKASTGKRCPDESIDDLIRRATSVRWITVLSAREEMTKEVASAEHAALLKALKKTAELTSRKVLSGSLEESICHHELKSIASGIGRSLGPNYRLPGEGLSLYDIPDILAPYIRLMESYKPKAIKPRLSGGADKLVYEAVEWAEKNDMAPSSYFNDSDGRQSDFLTLLSLLGKAVGIKRQSTTWRDKLQAFRRKSPP